MAVEAQLQVLAHTVLDLVQFHQENTWCSLVGPCDGSVCTLLTHVVKALFTKSTVCFSLA